MRRTPFGEGGSVHRNLRRMNSSNCNKNDQFPDDPVKTKGIQIRYHGRHPRRTRNRRDKGDSIRGTIIIISVVKAYFVISGLI